MVYACIGFIGVLIGALCVHLSTPVIEIAEEKPHYDDTQEDARLARQWQNILNYTADGGDDDEPTDG